MKTHLRLSTLAFSALLGTIAFAQPLPPYTVTVAGYVAGCTPGSYVNIATVQNTQPSIDIDVPLGPNCGFSVDLLMDSYEGWFSITTPCNGAIQTAIGTYMINSFFPDSNYVWVNLSCGSATEDCMGIIGGSALPGTACTTFFGLPGTWSSSCVCVADSTNTEDCLGMPGGTNLPGTTCQSPNGSIGIWSADCFCEADSTSTGVDCLGLMNGPNVPGSPCWMSNNTIGVWDANCDCVDGTINTGCEAAFWVMQAYEIDSMNPNGGGAPIPYELWIWNLSQGTGNLTYSWSFGDGTGSTDPYPTHVYSGNGPYLLCLTIADAAGCTSVSCDSISIDDAGILNGMILDHEATANPERSNGFTLNVRNPLTLGLSEVPALSSISLWPNPATNELNLSLSALSDGSVNVILFDVSGRAVRQENRAFNTGRNVHSLDITGLPAGVYTVRATDLNGNSISQRFAKAN